VSNPAQLRLSGPLPAEVGTGLAELVGDPLLAEIRDREGHRICVPSRVASIELSLDHAVPKLVLQVDACLSLLPDEVEPEKARWATLRLIESVREEIRAEPRITREKKAQRDASIIYYGLTLGWSLIDIGLKMRCSPTTVCKVLKRERLRREAEGE
jgi:hypothetical protein